MTAADVARESEMLLDKIAAVAWRTRRRHAFTVSIELLSESLVNRVAAWLCHLYRPFFAIPVLLVAAVVLAGVMIGRPAPRGDERIEFTYLVVVTILLCHELGHAAACKAFGARPSSIGFGLYLVFPALYCDVSSAWQLARWKRVVVDVGGLFFQLVATAIFGAVYLVSGTPSIATAVWVSVAIASFCLHPFLKMDGYWLVADAVGVPNLGSQPGRILRNAWARLQGKETEPNPWPKWVSIFLALYTVCAMAFWVWFIHALGPRLAGILSELPGQVSRLATDAWRGDVSIAATAKVATTSLLTLSAFVIVFRAVRRAAALLGSLRRRTSCGGPR
ncbi:MAG: hypothetical protein V2A73_20470 [Pseudomonadota bacterium]